MIVRIVKMTFKPECTEQFIELFDHFKLEIRNQPGCKKLSLLQDKDNPCVFMTYSWWEDEHSLNNYRKSTIFGLVWPATKKLFSTKPEAWSLNEKIDVNKLKNDC